jgi:thioredoxin-related protein
MKTSLLSATLLLCAVATPAAALTPDDSGVWHEDFDEAVAVAKEQGKDLFVDFTGSDWCSWCIKLHDEVFQYDTFLDAAQEDFVLVALDFPRSEEVKATVPNPERNDELQEKYGIGGFPTCLLMTNDGVVYARMGYQPDGPEKYITDMRENRTTGKALLAELAVLETDYAAATDKTPVVSRAIAMLADMDSESPGISIVSDMAAKALTLDPENRAGLKLAAMKSLLGAGQADEDVENAARNMDAFNEQGLLELVVEAQFGKVRSDETAKAAIAEIEGLLELGTFHEADKVKRMAAMAAMWCEGPLEDHDHAVQLARQAKAIEAEVDEGMENMLDEILG